MPEAYNCPTCAAPLDVSTISGTTMRCPYCGSSVLVPEELRAAAPRTGSNSVGDLFARSLRLAQIAELVGHGDKIGAIKLYRETFGVGLRDAKEAVENFEAGNPLTTPDASRQGDVVVNRASAIQVTHDAIRKKVKPIVIAILAVIVGTTILGIVLVFGGVIAAIFATKSVIPVPPVTPSSAPQTNSRKTPDAPAPPEFATQALEFGSEGIGAGQFQDARSLAVDGDGHIYVGEYTGGRVQVFDSNGKFITQWMVDPKAALSGMAADRRGIVYVAHPGVLMRYDGATGNQLGEVAKVDSNRYESNSDVAVGLDGSVYVLGSRSNITILAANGAFRSTINSKDKVGDEIDFDRIAVDGVGNVYALDTRQNSVFKFGADGRFINRFGGKGEQPGQLSSPRGIALDGKGRVYVSDAGHSIQAFDASGRFLGSFGGDEVVFGITTNDRNEVFATYRNQHSIKVFRPR